MLLSDELINTGLNANQKNNMSMANAEELMVAKCKTAKSASTQKQMENIVGFACEKLNKAGFSYYKASRILTSVYS